MKKTIRIALSLIAVMLSVVTIVLISGCKNNQGNTLKNNDDAQKNSKKERSITVINNTEQIINEVRVTVGEGTELEHAYQKNPSKTSFSIPISKDYKEYDEFTVILIDRYENEYRQTLYDVPIIGRTEVEITKDDIVKEPSLWKKFEMFVNND